ncbi:MAG: Lrp/AsnC family transcriptional regulator [Halobacteriales archaeon]
MQEPDTRAADLDETDLALLEYIESDFDVNLEELSEELGLSKSAIHYRINKLRDENIIQGVSAELDPLAFGLNMMMITEVSVTHERGYAEQIGEQLAAVDGVQRVYYTMGDVDFVVISRVQNRDQMNELLDVIVGIDGVNETSSRFVMQEMSPPGGTLSNMSDQMRETVLDHE